MEELIFGLIGGTALLMYGVDKMGEGLEKASGRLMKTILYVLTGRVWSAFLVGTLLTALVQSSTAITVLTVGFVNAGLMKLPQAIGIIYGANIGTTITAQLMAFSFHFKLTDIALPILGLGFAVNYFAKNDFFKNIGDALFGFGVMFLGLKILNSGIPFMKDNETLKFFFQNYASVPLIGVVLGAAATAMVHSSSATVGLVMVLGMAGLVDLQTSICIMLGDNIGTCLTAQLASFSGNIHARRTAWAHTFYNIFGVIAVLLTLPWFVQLIQSVTIYLQPNANIGSFIANSHTAFNIISAVVFLPITKYYVKFLELVVRGKEISLSTAVHLDKLLLDTPMAAIKATLSEMIRGAEISRAMLNKVMDAFISNNLRLLDEVEQDEEIVNQLQRDVTGYIVELSKHPLSKSQSVMVPALITGVNHIERAADHAEDMLRLVKLKIDRKILFSPDAIDEIKELHNIVLDMYATAIEALEKNKPELVTHIKKLEDQMDEMSARMVQNHINRLEEGLCRIEAGVLFIDIINYQERIADHVYKFCRTVAKDFKPEEETAIEDDE